MNFGEKIDVGHLVSFAFRGLWSILLVSKIERFPRFF